MEVKVFILAAIIFEVAVSVPVTTDLVQNPIGVQETQNDELSGIVGGKNITINKANYVVAIVTRDGEFLLGTGAILNNRWVVTAGFTVNNYNETDLYIKAGSSIVFNNQGKKVDVKKYFLHPRFSGMWHYDIALLKLQKRLEFSKTIGKISMSAYLPDAGSVGLISSFGQTSESRDGGYLAQTSSKVIHYEECAPYFKHVVYFSPSSYCSIQDGSGPCVNDFGAPLVYKKKIVGLFSGTLDCGNKEWPAVYLDTSLYKEWVDETIKKQTEKGEMLENDEELIDDEEKL